MDNGLMTLSEAATYLRLSRSRAYELSEAGTIPTVQIGGRGKLLFRREDLTAALQTRTARTPKTHRALKRALKTPGPTFEQKSAAISSALGE
jgi:excisionase family DNA binding protein